MATRSNNRNRYFVRLGRDQEFKLSAQEFHEIYSGGWIEPDAPGSSYASLRRGVVAWIRGGDLHLLSLANIRTATAGWWRAWLYRVDTVPASQVGQSLSERQEALLIEQERERQNEALLWRTFRDTKGANEFTWIPAETKAEMLKAFGVEMVQPAG
jgi:hypothetical protein